MRKLPWLMPLIFAASALADEAADRAAVAQAIGVLNQAAVPADLFEDSFDPSILDELRLGKIVQFRVLSIPEFPLPPALIISHQPWGEARIGSPLPELELLSPRFSAASVQFVGPDVALADGTLRYTSNAGTPGTTPLLFVLRRQGARWKIAAVRRLAP